MKNLSPRHKYIIIVDIIVLLISFQGIYNIFNKAGTPFNIIRSDNGLIISDKQGGGHSYLNNDQLLKISGYEFRTKEEIEIFLDGKNIGDVVNATLFRNGQILSFNFTTTFHYSLFYTIVAALVGILFFIVAIIVLIKCERKKLATAFHWAFIFTGVIILMTWGNYTKLPYNLGRVTRIGFHIGYLFAPIYFLKFSILFPSKQKDINKNLFVFLILVGAMLTSVLSYLFLVYSYQFNLNVVRSYVNVFDISSAFIILIIGLAILNFGSSYIKSKEQIYRKQTRWILIGFLVGPLSYVLLWIIPTRVWNDAPLPESVILLFIAFVPITFGIAIVKYRIMNVDIILKRGLVYTTVIVALLLIYSVILTVMAKVINMPKSDIASIIAAISIALLFEPAKLKVQQFVNKKFFRIEYDYRLALRLFNEKIKDIHLSIALIEKVLESVNSIIPLDKLGYFLYNKSKNEIELEQDINFQDFRDIKIKIKPEINLNDAIYPISTSMRIEPSVNVNNLIFSESDEINQSLIFSVKSETRGIHGFLILGEKKSETIFTVEDIDLINIIASRVGLNLDRIILQEEILREQLEKEHLEELNKLKSFFVSSVSHDLKTPLTSIKLFAERLRSAENIEKEKADEYLEIIEGESDRLTRLINNVLDYSKIEKGTQKYILEKINVVEIVKRVIQNIEYQFKIGKFLVFTEYEENEIFINGDEDSIAEALVNLISNSMKYSYKQKEIQISVYTKEDFILIDVVDFGRGISEEDIPNIFKPFFRSNKEKIDKTGGAGLGLTIVKHIMDEHGGKIKVSSKLGEGSKFTLQFPKLNGKDKHINN